MLASTAHVGTERPAVYLKQLCEHFADPMQGHSGQEFEVAFDEHEGLINFAPVVSGTCRLDARREGVLVLEANGADQRSLRRVQRIVTKHVERFGGSDALRVEWGPALDLP
jgi:uncharacterized protein